MIRDLKGRELSYDATTDEARLVAGAPAGPPAEMEALLLLDADGFLVGVDLGEGMARVVVLLGAFERVERTVAARVSVERDGDGLPARVRVPGARAAIRAAEPNPYV